MKPGHLDRYQWLVARKAINPAPFSVGIWQNFNYTQFSDILGGLLRCFTSSDQPSYVRFSQSAALLPSTVSVHPSYPFNCNLRFNCNLPEPHLSSLPLTFPVPLFPFCCFSVVLIFERVGLLCSVLFNCNRILGMTVGQRSPRLSNLICRRFLSLPLTYCMFFLAPPLMSHQNNSTQNTLQNKQGSA